MVYGNGYPVDFPSHCEGEGPPQTVFAFGWASRQSA